jgi:hypothetical protein
LAHAFAIREQDLAINPLPERPIVASGRPTFGCWLRDRLAALSTGGALHPEPRLSYRGSAADDLLPSSEALLRPLALPDQALTTEDGRTLQLAPTLAPTNPPSRGVADLLVLVRDMQGAPVAGVELELELDDLPFAGDAPSDAQGSLRIPDLPLDMLTTLESLELRAL